MVESTPDYGGELVMRCRWTVFAMEMVLAGLLVLLSGCKSGNQRLRELSAAHSRQWNAAMSRHDELKAACKSDAACIEAERKRHMSEMTLLVDKHNAEVLALVNGAN